MVVVFSFSRRYRIAVTQHLAIDTLGTLYSHKLYSVFSFVFILNTVSQLVVLCVRLLKQKSRTKFPSSAYIRLLYSIESAHNRYFSLIWIFDSDYFFNKKNNYVPFGLMVLLLLLYCDCSFFWRNQIIFNFGIVNIILLIGAEFSFSGSEVSVKHFFFLFFHLLLIFGTSHHRWWDI